LHDIIILKMNKLRSREIPFSGQKEPPCRDCQGFRKKYYPKGGDFFTEPRSGSTLTIPERHSGIFAQRKGDFPVLRNPLRIIENLWF
jgi:hypothetical protein